MPVFIFPPSGGGSPILSFLVGLATLAILIGLVIFFLPLIAGIVIAVIVLIAAVYCWGWLKRKFGWESEEEKAFRQVMEKAEAMARSQYHGGGTVYEREEIRISSPQRPGDRRRVMKDVEDIEETPVTPKDSSKS
ncbi:adenosylhomocysteine nucleosidase [uncultured Sutterella sp.]|uniref:adenosylhomocysteine nucleosidase n=1 Tax=uncultured Sutterella sp. TaxID=286133 RepID=UPI00262D6E06|nr:adenosylhomocysteine nucleosidase [uncultured Sutterella sp.]